MRSKTLQTTGFIAVCMTGMSLPATVGRADPGLQADLRVRSGLDLIRQETNGETTSETAESLTSLNFSLSSQTRGRSLSLTGATSLELSEDDAKFDNNSLRFNYEQATRSTGLSFSASLQESDIIDTVISEEDPEDLVVGDTGSRRNLSTSTVLQFGQNGPLGVRVFHRYRDITFVGTSDPSLRDSTNFSFGVAVQAQVNSRVNLRAQISQAELDQSGDGGTQRTTRTFDLGGEFVISDVVNLTAGLNYSDIGTNSSGSQSGGLGFNVGVNYNLANGPIRLSYSNTETVNGNRENISISKQLRFRWGSGQISVSGARIDGSDFEPVINANLTYNTGPRSSLNLSLRQQSATDNSNNETIQTRFSVAYQQTLTRASSLTASAAFARSNVLAEDGDDQEVLQLSLTYNYDLDRDWDLVTRYNFSQTDNSFSNDRTRNAVFFGVQRSFSFRP